MSDIAVQVVVIDTSEGHEKSETSIFKASFAPDSATSEVFDYIRKNCLTEELDRATDLYGVHIAKGALCGEWVTESDVSISGIVSDGDVLEWKEFTRPVHVRGPGGRIMSREIPETMTIDEIVRVAMKSFGDDVEVPEDFDEKLHFKFVDGSETLSQLDFPEDAMLNVRGSPPSLVACIPNLSGELDFRLSRSKEVRYRKRQFTLLRDKLYYKTPNNEGDAPEFAVSDDTPYISVKGIISITEGSDDNCAFVVKTFTEEYSLRSDSTSERPRWVSSLRDAQRIWISIVTTAETEDKLEPEDAARIMPQLKEDLSEPWREGEEKKLVRVSFQNNSIVKGITISEQDSLARVIDRILAKVDLDVIEEYSEKRHGGRLIRLYDKTLPFKFYKTPQSLSLEVMKTETAEGPSHELYIHAPYFIGYAMKRGEKKRSGWKRRYMCLEGCMLRYYRKSDDTDEIGFIDLNTVIDMRISLDEIPALGRPKGCHIEFETKSRTWHIMTDTKSQAERWMAELSSAWELTQGLYKLKQQSLASESRFYSRMGRMVKFFSKSGIKTLEVDESLPLRDLQEKLVAKLRPEEITTCESPEEILQTGSFLELTDKSKSLSELKVPPGGRILICARTSIVDKTLYHFFLEKPFLKGELYKKGSADRAGFKPRSCQLKGETLSYFKKKAVNPAGVISLEQVSRVSLSSTFPRSAPCVEGADLPRYFEIETTKPRIYYFLARSKRLASEWVSTLNISLDVLKIEKDMVLLKGQPARSTQRSAEVRSDENEGEEDDSVLVADGDNPFLENILDDFSVFTQDDE